MSSLMRKWESDSFNIEKENLEKRIYPAMCSLIYGLNINEKKCFFLKKDSDFVNKFYIYLKSIVQSDLFDNSLNVLLLVSPLVFLNRHRFYNDEIIEFLNKHIKNLSVDNENLEICFIYFTIIFFLYSGCDIENAVFEAKNIMSEFSDNSDLFNGNVISKLTKNEDIGKSENELITILRLSISCVTKSKKLNEIFENARLIENNVEIISGLAGFMGGLIYKEIPKNLNCKRVVKNIKNFFEYCLTK